MDEPIKRNPDGTFPKGVSGNPHGRPPKAREAAYLAIAHEIISADRWRAVVHKALLDALGQTTQPATKTDPARVVADADSTAGGRNNARTWLRDTLIGKPPQSIRLGDADDDPFEQFTQYNPDQLAAIIAAADAVAGGSTIQPDPGGGADRARGVGAPQPD